MSASHASSQPTGDVPQITSSVYGTGATHYYEPTSTTGGGLIWGGPIAAASLAEEGEECALNTPQHLRRMAARHQHSTTEPTMPNQSNARRLVQVFIADPDPNVPLKAALLYKGELLFTDATDQELYFEVPVVDTCSPSTTLPAQGGLIKRPPSAPGRTSSWSPPGCGTCAWWWLMSPASKPMSNQRAQFEMTQADLETILAACKPTPVMFASGGVPMFDSPQENANRAWAELGQRMGFEPMTVEPAGSDPRVFTAVPTTPTQDSHGQAN